MITHIQTLIETAPQRALATVGEHGVNVVPVSMARVVGDEVWLFNFFMNKTIAAIAHQPRVALACWEGLSGIQLKGHVRYETTGAQFENAVAYVASKKPARVVRGLLILSPTECFDISAGPTAGNTLPWQ